jgi:tRNA-splicing ligase RtcB
MSKLQIRGKDIRAIGYPEGPVVSMAIHAMTKHYKHHSIEDVLAVLKKVLDEPAVYKEDEMLGKIAAALIPVKQAVNDHIPLTTSGVHFNTFGAEFIEQGAFHQMYTAAKLPWLLQAH